MAAELVTDEWQGVQNNEQVVVEPTVDAIAEAIEALDGEIRTMVSIVYRHPSHMEIGGGGPNRLYVVQATLDGEHYKVATRDVSPSGAVMVTAGGQEGDYPARRCVDLETALRAARTFASTGELDPAITWEE